MNESQFETFITTQNVQKFKGLLSKINDCRESIEELQKKHQIELQRSTEEKIQHYQAENNVKIKNKDLEEQLQTFKILKIELEEVSKDKHLKDRINQLDFSIQEEKFKTTKILNLINQENNEKEMIIQQRNNLEMKKTKEIQDIENLIGEKNLIYQTMVDEEKSNEFERIDYNHQKEVLLKMIEQLEQEVSELINKKDENEKELFNKTKEIEKSKEEIERAKNILSMKIAQNNEIDMKEEERKLQMRKDSKLKEHQKKFRGQLEKEMKIKKNEPEINDLFEE